MANIVKKRIWWFILYPESAPKDWKFELEMTGIPFAVSPLHDKDIHEDTGELKKPHYHVIVVFDGPTTYNNVVSTITDPFNATSPKYIDKIKGPYLYLCHLKHPNKAQYNPDDIELYNDFDYKKLLKLSIEEEDVLFNDLENFILEKHITEFRQCISELKMNGDNELLSFFRRHTFYFDKLIDSVRYSDRDKNGGIV